MATNPEKAPWYALLTDIFSPQELQQIQGQYNDATIQSRQNEWPALIREVESAVQSGQSPTGPQGKALAQRWKSLTSTFLGNSPDVRASLEKFYASRDRWPAHQDLLPSQQVRDFIQQASAGA